MNSWENILYFAPSIVKDKLEDLKGLRENPQYHPEPSTYEHIRIVTERLIPLGDPDLVFAAVLHDICKLDARRLNPKTGRWGSPGHDKKAADWIKNNPVITDWIKEWGGNPQMVIDLVAQHMRFHQFGIMKPQKQQAFMKMDCWDKLIYLGAADNMLEDFDPQSLEKSWKWKKN